MSEASSFGRSQPAPPVPAGERPLILVVDDELGYREGIRRILGARGYACETAVDGADALRAAAEREFPIVLVDLKMPGVDGFELIRRVRERRPDTLCIVVSAFATIESAVQTTKMGAFDFVVKPFAPDDLLLVVNRAVDAWRQSRETARLRLERERHLLELAAEQSRLRTILQSMGDGLLVVNVDAAVVLDNPVARRLLDRVGSSSLSGPIDEVGGGAALADAVRAELALGSRAEGASLEIRLPSLEGRSERFLHAILSPVRDADGHVLGVVVILADVTDAKALERAKTRFIAMVAHELRAPIAAVEGYLHMMKTGSFDTEPGRLAQVAGRCLERTGALLCLIQDLLEITRRESGRAERHCEPLDLAALCAALVEFQRPLAAERAIELSIDAPASLPPLRADRAEVERVVTNLLSNAIKYNRQGGSVRVTLRTNGSLLVLEVSDDGIGMSAEERGRLGEEFFRAKNTATRGITGTGLGVALVKKIVAEYNGALEVESTPGAGSTFRVLWPLATPAS